MNEPNPQITTIIAVYNMADTLKRAIDSAVNQDYPNKELIIIEGASTDDTVKVLQANDHLIDHWESVTESERGIYKQWNKALPHVTGEWVNFLGADDHFTTNDALSRIAPYLVACDHDVRLVYGKIAMVTPEGKRLSFSGRDWEESKNFMFQGVPIPHPATFHHRSLFDIHGYFNHSFKISGDYEFLLRELKNGKAQFVPEIVIKNMTLGGRSTSWKHDITRLLENARSRKLNSMPAYTRSWFWKFTKFSMRHFMFRIIGKERISRTRALFFK
jgi:glycosyltransferase involved in cell wall biosynthesis